MRVLWLATLLGCPDPTTPGGDGPGPGPGDDTDTTPPEPVCPVAALRADGTGTPRLPVPGPGAEGAWLGARAVTVDADPPGDLQLAVSGPFTLLDAAGGPHAGVIAAADLPATVLVLPTGHGAGELTAGGDGCAAATLPVATTLPTQLAARALPRAPWAADQDTWRDDDRVDVVVDPALFPDRIGQRGAVHVVAHRSPAAWAADPALVDVTGAVEAITVPAAMGPDAVVTAWAAPVATGLAAAYDVVVDWGDDGRLDPGDLIDGLGAPGLWVAGDLSAPGPLTPTRGRINDGGWLAQEVWYPAEIGALPARAPLVVISHGNGHDYRWYGHLGSHLASWGFVVMSHKNNTEPGIQTASDTTLSNTEHFLAEHGGWFGGALADRVDVHNIAWIGHSRGGEGVVRAWTKVSRGKYTPTHFTAGDIRVVSSIAPTVFLGVEFSDPGGVAYHLITGSADGDVTGHASCDLCQSLRLPNAAAGEVAVTYVQGAWHNAFHDGPIVWNDATGPDPLPREKVQAVQNATYLALLGHRQLGVDGLRGFLTANPDAYRARGVLDEVVIASTWREDPTDPAQALWVDRFQVQTATDFNDLGGKVAWSGEALVEDLMDDGNADFAWRPGDPMNGMTAVERDGFERGVVFDWVGEASYTTRLLPGARDVRAWDVLTLRAAQGTRHPQTIAHGGPLWFAVELQDGQDRTARVETEPFGTLTLPYGRGDEADGVGWANEMGTIRVPLRAFLAVEPALDLADVRLVRLVFGPEAGALQGRIVLDDIGFARR